MRGHLLNGSLTSWLAHPDPRLDPMTETPNSAFGTGVLTDALVRHCVLPLGGRLHGLPLHGLPSGGPLHG